MTKAKNEYQCDLCPRPAPRQKYTSHEWGEGVGCYIVFRFCSLECMEEWHRADREAIEQACIERKKKED